VKPPIHEAVRNAEYQRQDQAVILGIVEASISRLGSAEKVACLYIIQEIGW
jgi:hypothetical protein